MKCPNCKQQVSSGSTYCDFCGMPVKRSIGKKLLTTALIALAAIAIFQFGRMSNLESEPTAATEQEYSNSIEPNIVQEAASEINPIVDTEQEISESIPSPKVVETDVTVQSESNNSATTLAPRANTASTPRIDYDALPSEEEIEAAIDEIRKSIENGSGLPSEEEIEATIDEIRKSIEEGGGLPSVEEIDAAIEEIDAAIEEYAKAFEQSTSKEDEDEDNNVYTLVEQMPRFPGGDAELMKWISSHIQHPESAKNEYIQGRVVVNFVVTKTGKIEDVKVANSKHPDLDREAIRVVKSLPDFIPGMMNGHPVNVWFSVPVNFKYSGIE